MLVPVPPQHFPPQQLESFSHLALQAPQFDESLCKSEQVPRQQTFGEAHAPYKRLQGCFGELTGKF